VWITAGPGSKAGAFGSGEYEMVKNPAVERLDSRRKMSCGPAVRMAGARIAARMIVREDYSGAAVQRGINNDGP
jgi:hypothetical protein